MRTEAKPPAFGELVGRINLLVGRLEENADPTGRATARELVGAVLDLHRAGLSRMLDLELETEGTLASLRALWAADDAVSGLLVLHGLHPHDAGSRVRRAIARLAAALPGGVLIVVEDVTDVGVRLRVDAGDRRVSGSQLRELVCDTLQAAAPELDAIQIEGLPPTDLHLAQFGVSSCGCHASSPNTPASIELVGATANGKERT